VPHWGRGYCTEAAIAIVEYGFNELGLCKVTSRHMAGNPASGRVMEKLGMTREGVERDHIIKWDRFESLAVYSILESEWRARRSER